MQFMLCVGSALRNLADASQLCCPGQQRVLHKKSGRCSGHCHLQPGNYEALAAGPPPEIRLTAELTGAAKARRPATKLRRRLLQTKPLTSLNAETRPVGVDRWQPARQRSQATAWPSPSDMPCGQQRVAVRVVASNRALAMTR